MVDYKKTIQSTLNNILPTQYELIVDDTCEIPCITYIETNNYSLAEGDDGGYSILDFTIKLWCDSVADMMTYALQIDKAMKDLGFHRTSSTELTFGTQLQKISVYEATGIEFGI